MNHPVRVHKDKISYDGPGDHGESWVGNHNIHDQAIFLFLDCQLLFYSVAGAIHMHQSHCSYGDDVRIYCVMVDVAI